MQNYCSVRKHAKINRNENMCHNLTIISQPGWMHFLKTNKPQKMLRSFLSTIHFDSICDLSINILMKNHVSRRGASYCLNWSTTIIFLNFFISLHVFKPCVYFLLYANRIHMIERFFFIWGFVEKCSASNLLIALLKVESTCIVECFYDVYL